jgi:glycine/D-amino acid oxidase-like deaminating enzyme
MAANGTLPASSDVLIVGGGIVGATAAYFLAMRGAKPLLVEKGRIAGEQSGRNWGFVRQQGRDPLEVPLIFEGIKLWYGFTEALGADIEFRKTGNLAIADTEALLEHYRTWLPTAQRFGIDTRLLDSDELAKLLPDMGPRYAGGLYTPSDGQADPVKATTAIARKAAELGARIVTDCAVRGIRTKGADVDGVETERGTVKTSKVLVAAGAWSARLLRPLGLSLPQLVIRATVAQTTPAARELARPGIWAPMASMRQRIDRSFNIAAGILTDYDIVMESLRHAPLYWPNFRLNRKNFRLHLGMPMLSSIGRMFMGQPQYEAQYEKTRAWDPAPNADLVARALAGLKQVFPATENLAVARSWAGAIDVMPDAIPVLGAVGRPRGLLLATGLSGHGFAMGPIIGRLMSELVADGRTSLPTEGFRFSRFAEGAMQGARSIL